MWSNPSHTSLVTCVRTHSLHGLVSAQDAKPKSGLLSQEMNFHILIFWSWGIGRERGGKIMVE